MDWLKQTRLTRLLTALLSTVAPLTHAEAQTFAVRRTNIQLALAEMQGTNAEVLGRWRADGIDEDLQLIDATATRSFTEKE